MSIAAPRVPARLPLGLKARITPGRAWNDTVPPAWPDTPAFLLHDGSGAPMPGENPLAIVPLAPEPVRQWQRPMHRLHFSSERNDVPCCLLLDDASNHDVDGQLHGAATEFLAGTARTKPPRSMPFCWLSNLMMRPV